MNQAAAQAIRGGQLVSVKWADVRVGDVLRVENGQPFPADMLLLDTANSGGVCFVETTNLDGETNLKVRAEKILQNGREKQRGLNAAACGAG